MHFLLSLRQKTGAKLQKSLAKRGQRELCDGKGNPRRKSAKVGKRTGEENTVGFLKQIFTAECRRAKRHIECRVRKRKLTVSNFIARRKQICFFTPRVVYAARFHGILGEISKATNARANAFPPRQVWKRGCCKLAKSPRKKS